MFCREGHRGCPVGGAEGRGDVRKVYQRWAADFRRDGEAKGRAPEVEGVEVSGGD